MVTLLVGNKIQYLVRWVLLLNCRKRKIECEWVARGGDVKQRECSETSTTEKRFASLDEEIGGIYNKKRCFKAPISEDKIYELSNKTFASESCRKIKWAVKMFNEWRISRMKEIFVNAEIRRCDLNFPQEINKDDLCFALSRFVREVKHVDNNEFPPNTLREIVVMVQMYLQQGGVNWKLLDDREFCTLRNVLDNTMKERHAQGFGVRQSAAIISLENEEKMFQCGALGEADPEQLLHTVIYMLGLHLALRGGVEHTRLRRPGFECQIETDFDEAMGKEILIYKEDPLQKTNEGGLCSKQTKEIVKVFPSENPSRCPVRLFGKYVGLLPNGRSCGKLYLRPKVKTNPSVWYCDQPYGKNKVCSTVKKLCEIAKIPGKFSNHSLRATSASRMFHKNVPEQVIKEITGHRSDCVRVYKKTNEELLRKASSSIGGNDKCDGSLARNDNGESSKKVEKVGVDNMTKIQKQRLSESLTAYQIIKNVVKTRMELRNKLRKPIVSKLAKKVLSWQRGISRIKSKKNQKKESNQKVVIDVNVNVNYSK